MHLTKMWFGGVPPFTGPFETNFDEQVNVFVGEKASEKSRVLSAIDEYFNPRPSDSLWPMTREQLNLKLSLSQNEDYSDDWVKGRNLLSAEREFNNPRFRSAPGTVPPTRVYTRCK